MRKALQAATLNATVIRIGAPDVPGEDQLRDLDTEELNEVSGGLIRMGGGIGGMVSRSPPDTTSIS